MEIDFSVISFNVRGLQQAPKRIKIFNYIREKLKNGFAFFQETHSSENSCLSWRQDWKGDLIYNHGTSNSRGTLIAFSENFEYKLVDQYADNEGRLQICSIVHDNRKFLLVNLYNENIEHKQVALLKKLHDRLETYTDIFEYEIIIGGDWNFILDKKLDAEGGNPPLKLSSIAELTKISEKFDLCDIFRIRNPEKRRFSFRQPTPRRLRRLDYFLISNAVQEYIRNPEILTSLSSDHSPVLIRFEKISPFAYGKNYWKYNSLMSKNSDFCFKLIEVIEKTKVEYDTLGKQEKLEILKYEIRKFSIAYAKKIAKQKRERVEVLEKNIGLYENTPAAENGVSLETYEANKLEFESLMDEKTGVIF